MPKLACFALALSGGALLLDNWVAGVGLILAGFCVSYLKRA